MAEKQVIRQDVVQVTWEVDDSPLGKINQEAKKFQSAFGKAVGSSESKFDKFSKNVSKGWGKTVEGAEKLKSKLDPLNTKINQLGKSALNAGKKIASGLGKTALKGVKVLAKGVIGLGAAFGGLVGLSVKGYSEYEQLVGGVDTLFKDANKTVLKYANDAYKTAGLSANAYMETVTSFSASLIQSVNGDTKKAAKLANQAIIDMSDNANKMGTDMESIQNAYQGFSKANYTMLDNLNIMGALAA